MNWLAIYCSFLGFCVSSSLAISQVIPTGDTKSGDINARQDSVSDFVSLQWDGVRNLTVMFDMASDRISLAELIVDECDENANLSLQQRTDGYRLAALTFFREGHAERASLTYTKIVTISVDPYLIADSYRMLGILAKASGEVDRSLSFYLSAWESIQILGPENNHFQASSILANVCLLSYKTGQIEDGLNKAILGALYFEDSPEPLVDASPFLYWQYIFNKEIGNIEFAKVILEDLLSQYDNYGLLGHGDLRAKLELERYFLQGSSFENPSLEFITEVSRIMNDEKYKFSTYRLHLARKLAGIYDTKGAVSEAIRIRTEVCHALFSDIDQSNLDNYDVKLLHERASFLLYDNVLSYSYLHDFDNTLIAIETLLGKEFAIPDLVYLATEIRDAMLDSLPSP